MKRRSLNMVTRVIFMLFRSECEKALPNYKQAIQLEP